MKIDAHHHLWHYSPGEYDWIDDRMQALRRDFMPSDLEREMEPAHVQATVVVQARQTLGETSWLLDLAADTLAKNPNLEGIAPIVVDSGEGRWTIKAAIDEAVPAPVLTCALYERFSSRGEARRVAFDPA